MTFSKKDCMFSLFLYFRIQEYLEREENTQQPQIKPKHTIKHTTNKTSKPSPTTKQTKTITTTKTPKRILFNVIHLKCRLEISIKLKSTIQHLIESNKNIHYPFFRAYLVVHFQDCNVPGDIRGDLLVF